ncbi:MAG: hypothetical protein F4Z51_09765 [Chloroflexi bacterium]|nr:hypothetical protein [Chloroflexota bacterium]MYD16107.1 hypothetical protein [Chloroflexota bacterium]MYJ01735.1 hypothetical protein [Chloroflexota bacterium]
MPLSNATAAPPGAHAAASAGQLLDRHEDAIHLAERIRSHGIMGLDTEFISERTYQPQLCLLQVSTPDGVTLIDPLAEHIQQAPDQPIWDAMADPSVRTVVHAHDQESRFCLQRTGRPPGDLFDVQLAAAFNGHHFPIAYDRLVGVELRRSLGPSQSRTDWMRRPLTEAQQTYAADDVRWLLRLHDRFVERMDTEDGGRRHDWLRQETAERLNRLGDREADRWRKLRGANKLSSRSLAALRELSAWRESVAGRRNVPLRRIVSDELLVAIAATLPRSTAELTSVRGQTRLQAEYRQEVMDAVGAALSLPESELPERARSQRGAKPSRMVVLFLESVLAAACAEHRIDPALVGSSSQIKALVAWNEHGRQAEQTPALLRGWRGEVCGDALLQSLEGRVSLRINDPLSANPLAVGGLGAE